MTCAACDRGFVPTSCTFDPTVYAGLPMGMFHCPECGEMQLAGEPHLPEFCEACGGPDEEDLR